MSDDELAKALAAVRAAIAEQEKAAAKGAVTAG
jgi:hypothetical protein